MRSSGDLTDTDRHVYEAISAAAEKGKPCPRNAELVKLFDGRAASNASIVIKKLERANLISVERAGRFRTVTILATGKSTAAHLRKIYSTADLATDGDYQFREAALRIASLTGQRARDIFGPSREKGPVRARHALAWVIKSIAPTIEMISLARAIGRIDHSTAVYALQRAEYLRSTDRDFRSLCEEVLQSCGQAGRRPTVVPAPQFLKEHLRRRPWLQMNSTDGVVWFDRPAKEKLACEKLLDDIPLEDVRLVRPPAGTGEPSGDPRLSGFEIARRARSAQEARKAREIALLAIEQERYGTTRQTRVRPMSEMVA